MTETVRTGELRITRYNDLLPDRSPFVIEQADPVARITAELLREAATTTEWGDPYVTLRDDVLTLRARNRTVVYVVDREKYDAPTDTYQMRWPD